MNLSKVAVGEEEYYQGLIPFYGADGLVGSLTMLQPLAISASRTWQMVELLGLVFIGCILLIVPLCLFGSNHLIKPIRGIINILKQTTNQVSGASDRVASTSLELSEGAGSQASAIEENLVLPGANGFIYHAECGKR